MKTLQERNNWLYLVTVDFMYDKPIQIKSFWPLGMKASDYKRTYGAERIGQKMYRGHNPGEYFGEDSLLYRLVNGGATVAEFNEQSEVPKPKTKLECIWRYGRWEKKTSKGWVIA